MNIRDGSRRQRIAAASLIAALPVAVGLSSLCLPTAARQGIAGAYKKVRAVITAPARRAHASHTVTGPVPLPRYVYSTDDLLPHVAKLKAHAVGARDASGGTVQIDEPVQTFDALRPSPAFTPVDNPQDTINLTPVFTPDEQWVVYSSNRNDPNGHYHIWAVPARGGTPVQVTTSSSDDGDDLYPVVSPNGDKLAFVSDAATPGQHNLYAISFSTANLGSAAAADVDSLASLTLRNDIAVGFADVGRPTWSPAEDQIVFPALTSEGGADDNLYHLYYLYTGSRGYLRSAGANTPNPPGKITSGPENDTDPAWSPDGNFIAFASSASAFGNTGQGVFPDPTSPAQETTPVAAGGTQAATGGAQPTGIFLLTNSGTVPASLSSTGGLVTNPGTVDGGPAWCPNGTSDFAGYLAFSRGSASATNSPSQIFYFQANNGGVPQLEPLGGATQLITDNPNTVVTSPVPAPVYNDLYPSWPAFVSGVSLAYQSNRTVTYNDPANGDAPSETAISVAPGTYGLGAAYTGILESEIEYVNPPTLLRYDTATGEIVHITQGSDPTSAPTRYITPGTPVTFTVRLSNREAGIDNTGGPKDASSGVNGPNVFIQIKDPDSKYQDSKQIEHKLFTNPDDISAPLYNGDRGDLLQMFGGPFTQPGAIGGVDPNGNLISIGRIGLDTSEYTSNKKYYKNFETGSDGKNYHLLGIDTTQLPLTPWGQEYECQYVNPYYNTGGNTDTTAADYGTPTFLAGWSDQDAFSAPDTSGGAPAGWLQLRKAQVQDNNGGVLYTATWTTPTSPSDYYIDVIAFDNAKNAIQATANNWRIYDNVWGFTTQQFGSGNGILLVSDNALGQKFAASLYGRTGTSSAQNLRPTYYGAESYYTGVDIGLLPNAIDYEVGSAMGSPVWPKTDPPATTGTAPTALTLYPYINEVTLSWAGIIGTTTAPLVSYKVYRNGNLIATIPAGANQTDYDDVGSFFGDPTDGNSYTYTVTAVTQSTTGPVESAGVSATVVPPGLVAIGRPGLTTLPIGDPIGEVPVTDANGNVSVLTTNDNAVENTLGTFSHDANHTKYDIWRTLARGPIDEATLMNYGGTKETQPSVTPIGTGTAEPAASFDVAPKCVVWVTPYTGNLLVGPGSFADPSTQAEITDFINAGGRLCVSGQDLASTLAPGGNSSASPGFLGSVLGATYTASITGNGTQTLAANTSAPENRISGFGLFNPVPVAEPEYATWSGIYRNGIPFPTSLFNAPNQNPLQLSSNAGYMYLNDGTLAVPALGGTTYRTDGALTEPLEVAPWVFDYGPGTATPGDSVTAARAQIDTISPITGISGLNPIQDLAFSPTSIGTGGGALQYYANTSSGGRVVLGSFGLEGLGTEFYGKNFGGVNYFFPYNQRQHVLYNIVTYLRTCTVTGKVSLANGTIGGGVAVPGATVYLVPTTGTIPNLPAGRTTYSATTNSSGVYTIDGVEAGNYNVVAYKSGYVSTESLTFITAMPQSPQTVNLNLTKLTDGTISGKVTYPAIGSSAPVPVIGATVKFVSSDGQATVTGVTDQNGNYSIGGVPAAASPGRAYTGTATFGLGTSETETVSVQSAQSSTANFIIPGSNTLAGKVVDATSGAGIPGVTVSFTDIGGTTVTATTDASGSYTSPVLEPGLFTITASLTPAYIPATVTDVILGDSPTPTPVPDIALTKLLPGVLTGKVTYSDTGAPAVGATVTFTAADGTTTYTATVASDGTYKITNVPSGPDPGDVYTGSASQNGVTSATKTADLPNHATVTTDFTLGPVPGVFKGTVEDAVTKLPIAGVTVVIASSDGATTESVTTDSAGAYTSPFVLPGTYTISVDDRPAYQLYTLTGATMTDNGTVVKNLLLSPVQAGTLTGKVTYSDTGAPAVGATVTFTAADGTTVTGTANASGVYTIANVPTAPDPGKDYTGAASQNGVTSASATVTLPSAGKITTDFTLGPVPGVFTGVVTDATTGATLTGASVVFTDGTGTAVASLTTDASGAFQTGNLAPGTYTVTTSFVPHYLPTTKTVTMSDNGNIALTIKLSPVLPGTITGHVYYQDGKTPASGATVTFTGPDSTGATTTYTATANTSGAYSITNVTTTTSGVTLTGTATIRGITSTSAAVIITSGLAVKQDFTMPPVPGDISGKVTAAAGNTPLSGATLALTDASTGTAVATTTSAADGTYTLPNVAPGTYNLSCSDNPYYVAQVLSVTLLDNQELTKNFSLTATPVATIGGLVTIGTLKKIVSGASVVLKDSKGNTIASTTTSDTTTSSTVANQGDGKAVNYSFTVKDPGSYTLTITDQGFAPITVAVTVTLDTFIREDATIPAVTTFTAGLHLFSLPYDYSSSSWDALFGTVLTSSVSSNGTRSHIAFRTHASVSGNRSSVAIYDPLTVGYVFDPTAPADAPHAGLGYWVRLNGPTDIDVPPTSITASTVSVPLHAYWNMIGVPSTTPIPVSSLQFQTGSSTLSFVQASSSATGSLIIDPTLYAYDPTSNAYTPIKGTDQLQPWQGYWIKAYQDVTVIIPTTGTSSSSSARRK